MRSIRIKTDYTGVLIIRELITHHLDNEMIPGNHAATIIYSLLMDQLDRFNGMRKTKYDRNQFDMKLHDAVCLQLVLTNARFRLLRSEKSPLALSYAIQLEEQINKQLA